MENLNQLVARLTGTYLQVAVHNRSFFVNDIPSDLPVENNSQWISFRYQSYAFHCCEERKKCLYPSFGKKTRACYCSGNTGVRGYQWLCVGK